MSDEKITLNWTKAGLRFGAGVVRDPYTIFAVPGLLIMIKVMHSQKLRRALAVGKDIKELGVLRA